MKRFFCFLAVFFVATVAFAANEAVIANKENGTSVVKPRDEDRAPSFWEWLLSQFGPSKWVEYTSEDDPETTILLKDVFSFFEMEEND